MKILLDYGHGGIDPGAVCKGITEKSINFSVGKKLKHYLEINKFSVLESRVDDSNPSLYERSNLANKNNSDLTISLHCNSYDDERVQGVEIFSFPNSKRSMELSKIVLTQLTKDNLCNKIRGNKEENFHMLRETKMTSILIEMGFITNSQDREILLNKQDELAKSICKGILNFYEMKYIEEDIVYKVQVGAYKNRANAEKMKNELKKKGYDCFVTK